MKRPILEIGLHGSVLIQVISGDGRFTPPERIEAGPEAEQLCASWDTIPNGRQLEFWLQALLPQGGARSFHREKAQETFEQENILREAVDSADAIWGVPGREYAGAATFRSLRDDGSELEEPEIDDRAIDMSRIRRELVRAIAQMRRTGGEDTGSGMNLTASSGVLAKLGLHLSPDDGKWYLPGPNRLSTHLMKHEDRGSLPAEAAVESICQRTLTKLGVRAARTQAAMVEGFQVILSERSERKLSPETGRIERVYQEEWIQAAGLDPTHLSQTTGTQAGWKELHTILSAQAADPQGEREHLWEMLGACVMLGHRDLHRRNVGVRHGHRAEEPRIELAPMYDVSSMDGQAQGYSTKMPMRIGDIREIEAIGEDEWVKLARECKREPEEVLIQVRWVAKTIEEAFAEAIREAMAEDEWKSSSDAMNRLAKVQEGIQRRSERSRLQTRVRTTARSVPGCATTMLELRRSGGEITLQCDKSGINIIHAEGKTETLIGRVGSMAEYCRGLKAASPTRPEDIPQLERTLERQRQIELRNQREKE